MTTPLESAVEMLDELLAFCRKHDIDPWEYQPFRAVGEVYQRLRPGPPVDTRTREQIYNDAITASQAYEDALQEWATLMDVELTEEVRYAVRCLDDEDAARLHRLGIEAGRQGMAYKYASRRNRPKLSVV